MFSKELNAQHFSSEKNISMKTIIFKNVRERNRESERKRKRRRERETQKDRKKEREKQNERKTFL